VDIPPFEEDYIRRPPTQEWYDHIRTQRQECGATSEELQLIDAWAHIEAARASQHPQAHDRHFATAEHILTDSIIEGNPEIHYRILAQITLPTSLSFADKAAGLRVCHTI